MMWCGRWYARLEMAHPHLEGHSERVATYAVAIGCELGLSKPTLRLLRIAGALHDIGMLALLRPAADQSKPHTRRVGTDSGHPTLSVQLLRRIHRFKDALVWVECHHERWDGRGYPFGWREEQIPLPARILAVAEAFDGMRTLMPYRDALSEQEALGSSSKALAMQFRPPCGKSPPQSATRDSACGTGIKSHAGISLESANPP